ncbi:uncharacterized protein LOC118181147 [Stegodyphus dumicola]|uniref:uncharacterized protein LOC118181147 n=1 Tax=Stegodyphus dumicola TaxID=202533 RepID=UPI0015AA2FE9|nr:uncharacterized protein LOC118181147 [Stegodyphus dumicola]
MYLEETGETLSAPLKIPRLRKDAVPTKLPGAPSYLSTDVSIRESVKERQTIRENRQLQMAISKSIMSKKSEDSKSVFTTFSELQNCLNYNNFTQKFTVVMKSNTIVIGIFEISPSPVFKYCISINNSMQLSAFHQSAELKVLNDSKLPMHVKSIHEIDNILNALELLEAGAPESIVNIINFINIFIDKLDAIVSDDKKCVLTFLKEQLNLLCLPKQRLRYSPHFLIFACILNSISPHAYKFMRNSGNLIMPHTVTLRNICSNLNVSVSEEQQHSNFLRYIKQKFKTLKECEHNVILMMDEIHLKPFYDFKGGNIVGSAYDSAFAASSAYTFMIRSLLSSYKDVAHILPIKSFSAEKLFEILRDVIVGLEKIGLKVVCVVSDNNSINRKAMSFFSEKHEIKIMYQNPYEPHRPLFFVIDPVHLLKCIRNNWIGQKNDGLFMYFPKFNAVGSEEFNAASFNTIRKLHDLEFDSLIKYGYGLTLKALWPSNLERQNVKLVLQVFNNWVITALTELGNKHNLDSYESTANYIDIIYKWWCIVNTKTPLKGKRLKCSFQEPLIFSNVDSNVEYLNNFVNWLDKWKDAKCTTGCLSKETHDALRNTTYALIELGKYCIKELGMNYFLPGKIQTDLLEDRFGKYRQLSGSQYCISIRQVYESESKLRMQSLLPLKLNSSTFGNIAIEINERNDREGENIDVSLVETFSLVVSENEMIKAQPYVPILTYIAGYCLYSLQPLKNIHVINNL